MDNAILASLPEVSPDPFRSAEKDKQMAGLRPPGLLLFVLILVGLVDDEIERLVRRVGDLQQVIP